MPLPAARILSLLSTALSMGLMAASAAQAIDPGEPVDRSAAVPAGDEASAAEASNPASARVDFGPRTGLVVDAGASRLELHAYTWLRAQTDTRIGGETDLEASIPVGRVFLTGSLFDSKLSFFAQPEFAGSKVELLDLFAEWEVSKALRFRGGQFRTPYSRAFITPLTNLQLTSRGLVVASFGQGRDTGVMASGALAGGHLHYDLAVVNGATINDRRRDRDAPAVIARTEFRFGDSVPFDEVPSLLLDDPHGLAIGLGGAFSRNALKSAGQTTTEEFWNGTADLVWMHGPLSLHVEAFLRAAHDSPKPGLSYGAYSQLGVFVVPRQLEVGGRVGWISPDRDVFSYEAFVANYWKVGELFLGHHLKTILAYRHDTGDATGIDSRDRHLAQIQTQFFF
jgi:hypothetical protein